MEAYEKRTLLHHLIYYLRRLFLNEFTVPIISLVCLTMLDITVGFQFDCALNALSAS